MCPYDRYDGRRQGSDGEGFAESVVWEGLSAEVVGFGEAHGRNVGKASRGSGQGCHWLACSSETGKIFERIIMFKLKSILVYDEHNLRPSEFSVELSVEIYDYD